MEHILLLATTRRSKELVIGSARLGNNLIVEANQGRYSTDKWVHGDWYFPFDIRNSGNGMSVDFGRNTDEKLE